MLTQRCATIVVFLLAALHSGCGSWFPRKGLSGIAESQVIGTWQLRPEGASRFLDYPVPPGTTSTVEFRSDGSCSLSHLVDSGDLFTGEGGWSLRTEPDSQGGRQSVVWITLPSSSGGRPHMFSYFFAHAHRELILWQGIGDPDEREFIEYERI